MQENYKVQYTIMGIALAGVWAHSPNPYSATSPISTTIPDNRLMPYLGEVVEGGTVIDKRLCSEGKLIDLVMSGPMLQESLPSRTVNGALTKDHRTVGIETPASEAGLKGFDYVSLDLYLELWREAGALIGKRQGEKIVWEDGRETVIPSESERFRNAEGVRGDDPWINP